MTESNSYLESIAYDAFVYSFPMLEQVKTANAMMTQSGMRFNEVVFNPNLPWDNVGMPIVAPNLTSMTGGVLIDVSHGPVTLQVPEVTDRYIVFQCIDGFTHNFHYIGTRADGGRAGRHTFHRPGQQPAPGSTPVAVETDHAVIVIRIDIADESELPRLREIMDAITVIDQPAATRPYPIYDPDAAESPGFVKLVGDILVEPPDIEADLFADWASIGLLSGVDLGDDELADVQRGIDRALVDIADQSKTATALGNGWIGATTLFGNREFLDGNSMNRAIGAYFGLWGNSQEEANYFLADFQGDSTLRFAAGELPPLLDIGFWSLTIHDRDQLVRANEFDSYVLTMEQVAHDPDGGVTIRFSRRPEPGNWLYTPGDQYSVLLRAYQADPVRIGDYVPPAFVAT